MGKIPGGTMGGAKLAPGDSITSASWAGDRAGKTRGSRSFHWTRETKTRRRCGRRA